MTAADCAPPSVACALVVCDPRSARCVELPPDVDADGHGDADCVVSTASLPNDDCDDTDNTRFPSNTETCDSVGHDEDCDFRTVGDDVDEDGDGQAPVACSNVDDATGEVIYGSDCDDRNSGIMAGMIADGPSLNCDGADNDCDGQIDLGCACAPAGLLRECGVQSGAMGACGAGLQTCAGGAWGECLGATAPAAERCDPPGVDEDCDGAIDDGCEGCVAGEMRPCGGGVFNGGSAACRQGTQRCTDRNRWGGCDGAVGPRPERCDGSDDDCDGTVDEEPESGLSCAPPAGVTAACVTGRCAVTACPPGLDDCDGDVETGCEEDLGTSERHCGGCGRACAAGQDCVGGVCDPVVQVTTGYAHSCALRHGGSVLCWGDNSAGQVGDGTTDVRLAPVPVLGVVDAVEVRAGYAHVCVRNVDGTVACWGSNDFGQLGDGMGGAMVRRATAAPVPGLAGARAIASGGRHSCALLGDGSVTCWGDGSSGQLGDGLGMSSLVPVAVADLDTVDSLGLGSSHSCATRLGRPWCWGDDGAGQASGAPSAMQALVPVMVDSTRDSNMQIAAGLSHSCSLSSRGEMSAHCWGLNDRGQLGSGSLDPASEPVTISGLGAIQLAAGVAHTCARRGSGLVACWGSRELGELGDGASGGGSSNPVPTDVPGLSGVIDIASRLFHTCAVLDTGGVVCWGGGNGSGEIGDGTMIPRTTPTSVLGLP